MPSGSSTRPRMPVSSSTSRTAASGAVSPGSTWPFGSTHSSVPWRVRRPISATSAGAVVGLAGRPGRRPRSPRRSASAAGPGGRTRGRDTGRSYERVRPSCSRVRAPVRRSLLGPPRPYPCSPCPPPQVPASRAAEPARLTAGAAPCGRRAGPGGTRGRRAGRAVRRGRARAGAGRRLGARRAARPARRRPRLRHLRPARAEPSPASRAGPTPSGTSASRSAPSALSATGTGSRSRPTAARRTTRSSRKPEVPYGDTLDGDLLRRDFTVNAMAVTLPDAELRRPVRRPGRPGRRAAAHPGHAAGVLLRRPAADDAGGPVRRPARLRRSTRTCARR